MKIQKLVEGATDLYKGIFWIVNMDDIYANDKYCFLIPTDMNGKVASSIDLNAKSGTTYNHERTWKMLSSVYTHGKPYNYYPRGRVEIANGKAIIYLNPVINTEEVKRFLTSEFHLYEINGIKSVRMISDGSEHYKCYLDS